MNSIIEARESLEMGRALAIESLVKRSVEILRKSPVLSVDEIKEYGENQVQLINIMDSDNFNI